MTTDEMLLKAAKRWVREHPNDAEILRVDYSTFGNGFLVAAERACWLAMKESE